MPSKIEELEAAVLALDMEDRASLVSKLLLSLESPEEAENQNLWLEEARIRRLELLEGKVKSIPGDEVLRRAAAEIS